MVKYIFILSKHNACAWLVIRVYRCFEGLPRKYDHEVLDVPSDGVTDQLDAAWDVLFCYYYIQQH